MKTRAKPQKTIKRQTIPQTVYEENLFDLHHLNKTCRRTGRTFIFLRVNPALIIKT